MYKDRAMPDDTVTTSWKRSTDKVKTPYGASVHRSLTEASKTLRQEAHPGPLGAGSPAAEPAAAGCLTGLATWEDEGGTTVFVD